MTRAALLILLLLAGCKVDYGRGASEPPKAYQSDGRVAVDFYQPDQVAADCAGAAREAGVHVEACLRGGAIEAPNPCAWPGPDPYADLLCHELGHWNGWPANHPRSQDTGATS